MGERGRVRPGLTQSTPMSPSRSKQPEPSHNPSRSSQREPSGCEAHLENPPAPAPTAEASMEDAMRNVSGLLAEHWNSRRISKPPPTSPSTRSRASSRESAATTCLPPTTAIATGLQNHLDRCN